MDTHSFELLALFFSLLCFWICLFLCSIRFFIGCLLRTLLKFIGILLSLLLICLASSCSSLATSCLLFCVFFAALLTLLLCFEGSDSPLTLLFNRDFRSTIFSRNQRTRKKSSVVIQLILTLLSVLFSRKSQ